MSLGGVTLNYTQLYRAAHAATSKIQIPVSPGQVLYAHFRHVQGVVAGPNDQAAPLGHLKTVDALIQALNQRGIKVPKILEEAADPVKILGHLKSTQVPNAASPLAYKPTPSVSGILVDVQA